MNDKTTKTLSYLILMIFLGITISIEETQLITIHFLAILGSITIWYFTMRSIEDSRKEKKKSIKANAELYLNVIKRSEKGFKDLREEK